MAGRRDLIGKVVLEDWHIDEFIGSGGYGDVYKASRKLGKKRIYAAVKHIVIPDERQYRERLSSMRNDKDATDKYFKSIFNDFIAEIETMYRLAGNTNIVSYFSHNIIEHVEPRRYEIVIGMEYLTSLPEYFLKNEIKLKDVIKIGVDIAEALEICHEDSIIHRDIKESNIFVSSKGVYKLGDFGVAKALKETSKASSMKGTEAYIAPEISMFKNYDKTVDIYSLGIVLYKILNQGRLPFLPPYPLDYDYKDEEQAVIKRMRGDTMEGPVCAVPELSEIILKACAHKVQERYQTVNELKMALMLAQKELDDNVLDTVILTNEGEYVQENTRAVTHVTFAEEYDHDKNYKRQNIYETCLDGNNDLDMNNDKQEQTEITQMTNKKNIKKGRKLMAAVVGGVIIIVGAGIFSRFGMGNSSKSNLENKKSTIQTTPSATPAKGQSNSVIANAADVPTNEQTPTPVPESTKSVDSQSSEQPKTLITAPEPVKKEKSAEPVKTPEPVKTQTPVKTPAPKPIPQTKSWQSGVRYNAGDEVVCDNLIYKCLKTHFSNQSTRPSNDSVLGVIWESQ